MSQTRLSLDRRIDIAARLTERARAYLDVFEFLEDVATRPHIVDAMNDYYWYFYLQPFVYRSALLVEVATLFHGTRDGINLVSLVSEAKSYLAVSEWRALKTKVEGAQTNAKKVILVRNKALAHRSAELDYNAAFERAQLTRNQMAELIEVARAICDVLCEKRGCRRPISLLKNLEGT